jgi:hypothetical protein
MLAGESQCGVVAVARAGDLDDGVDPRRQWRQVGPDEQAGGHRNEQDKNNPQSDPEAVTLAPPRALGHRFRGLLRGGHRPDDSEAGVVFTTRSLPFPEQRPTIRPAWPLSGVVCVLSGVPGFVAFVVTTTIDNWSFRCWALAGWVPRQRPRAPRVRTRAAARRRSCRDPQRPVGLLRDLQDLYTLGYPGVTGLNRVLRRNRPDSPDQAGINPIVARSRASAGRKLFI